MALDSTQRSYVELHIAVLLFGFTAILGELISLSSLSLVWWRVLLTSISLLFMVKWWKTIPALPRKLQAQYVGIGIIVALHWLTFYGSIKLSNASVTLVCMATASFFTALLEPLVTKTKIKKLDVGLGLLIVPGMALIIGSLPEGLMTGAFVGLVSAFLAALFSVLNKQVVDGAPPLTITLIELGAATLFLSLIIPFVVANNAAFALWPQPQDWIYLTLLAFLCTTLAYVLVLRALKHLTAFTSNLAVNLEPVYGIILAAVILKNYEELNPSFYIGAAVIIAVVLVHPVLTRRFRSS